MCMAGTHVHTVPSSLLLFPPPHLAPTLTPPLLTSYSSHPTPHLLLLAPCSHPTPHSPSSTSPSLFHLIPQILTYFVQLCLALKHVHDRKILHRDIKSQVKEAPMCPLVLTCLSTSSNITHTTHTHTTHTHNTQHTQHYTHTHTTHTHTHNTTLHTTHTHTNAHVYMAHAYLHVC